MMDYQEAIENHIKECRHRIDIIRNHMNTNGDADKGVCNKNIEVLEISIHVMQELQQYKQIGTLEEVREAVEKQHPKTPTYDGDGYAPDGSFIFDEWECPRCGTRYEVDYDDYDYCPNCGQHIDLHAYWSDEDDTSIKTMDFIENPHPKSGEWRLAEDPPEDSNFVLLSFANFSTPLVGRYEEDEEGGAYYIGDDDEPCTASDVFVDAWMPLPDPYRMDVAKKQTNADRIRSMTDEELAEFIERFGTFNQPCNISKGKPLEWLQSEVEE